ncbi:RNA polymerase subunit sigma-70 [Amycolatopsis nigrescens]|uniref:RNA polymerase subunit sigma-70 n=1 Tax=Amycolatopsis nigrescens TaxID=381445 RepID=UPI00036B52E0|nr:RNA polymerase subunit sigma-70 [Amycolatopsis nigrescens]
MAAEDEATVEAARAGDEAAFARLVGEYRRELRVHCYRLVGSFDDAEDLVQETLLRGWRRRESFQGRSTFRAWLYRIATNACLDFLRRRPERRQAEFAEEAGPVPAVAVRWLQPFPDAQLATTVTEPDAVVVARETVELAFLTAMQFLRPRQRAALVLRDILGWTAQETAELLETSVESVNSSVQRARAEMRRRTPDSREEWAPADRLDAAQQDLVRRYLHATERGDLDALAALMREDLRFSQAPGAGGNMTPDPVWQQGRDIIVASWAPAYVGADRIEVRAIGTRANGCPAVAAYARVPGDRTFVPFGLVVLRVEGALIAEITCFGPEVFASFDLPAEL